MYLSSKELKELIARLCTHFEQISFLMDCYSCLAAKMSKYRNPIHEVGVTNVYGIDDPKQFQSERFLFAKEHPMTPKKYIDELTGVEKVIFEKLYAGRFSKQLYRLFEYRTI